MASCSSSDPGAAATSETTAEAPTTATTSTPTTAAPATSTVPPPTFTPPQRYRVPYSDAVLKAADFAGDASQFTDEIHTARLVFYDVVCEGVPDIALATSPVSERLSAVGADHFHFARSLKYTDEQQALAALDQMENAYDQCNGGEFRAPAENALADTPVLVDTSPLATPALNGTSASAARTLRHTYYRDLMYYELRAGVVGPVLFVVASTSSDQAHHVAQVVADRLAGLEPSEPVQRVEPWVYAGGYASAQYWSRPVEGPQDVRRLPDLPPEVAAWIDQAEDDEIDEIASTACAFSRGIIARESYPERFDRTVSELFNWFDRDEYGPETLRVIYNTIASAYCPGATEQAERFRADA